MTVCNTLETFPIPMFDPETGRLIFLIVINAVNGAMDGEVTPDATRKSHWTNFAICTTVACSKRSNSGERCEVKKATKSRGGLGREVRERW